MTMVPGPAADRVAVMLITTEHTVGLVPEKHFVTCHSGKSTGVTNKSEYG